MAASVVTEICETTDSPFHKIVHKVTVSDGDPRGGWYRQMVSMSAMYHRSLNRWYEQRIVKKKWGESNTRFSRNTSLSEMVRLNEAYVEMGLTEILYTYEVVNHNSLWDFYDYIGYDHKNKSVKHIDEVLILFNK